MSASRQGQLSKEECSQKILFAQAKLAAWCGMFNTNNKVDYSGQWVNVANGIPVIIKPNKDYCTDTANETLKIIESCEKTYR